MNGKLKLKGREAYKHLEEVPVAYFCAEYAIDGNNAMYAGGLGVLAGDYVMETADSGLPFVALGLKYGNWVPDGFEVLTDDDKPIIIELPIQSRTVFLKIWYKRFGDSTILFLMDTDTPENNLEDQAINDHIYDHHFYLRLEQQMIIGLGGVKLLERLGISPSVYHLNEGHAAFAAMGLAATYAKRNKISFLKAHEIVREKIVATKHTIFSEAGMYIRSGELIDFISSYCKEYNVDPSEVFSIGVYEFDQDTFSTTKFMVNSSIRTNGVSILHTVFEEEKHPQSNLIPITNGVNKRRWRSLLWIEKMSAALNEADFWNAKTAMRAELISFVKEQAGVTLDPNALTIVWARRFAGYKRPGLLFSDMTRLRRICSDKNRKVQFIFSGRAHDSDQEGQKTIEKIKMTSLDPMMAGSLAYVPNYSAWSSEKLVRGADVWLNTPERGKEACGTSGMKAGLNGGLQLSVSDGWVDEVDWTGKGWTLPPENTAEALYNILEKEIVPEFYSRNDKGIPETWIRRMRATIDIVESRYSSERMLRDYIKKLYKVA